MMIPDISDYTSIGIPSAKRSLGDELFVLSPEELDVVSKLEPNTGLLIEYKDELVDARYLLNSKITLIGRNESADILLDDNTISRKHAEIQNTSEAWLLKDLGSLNGTYVNNERIEAQAQIKSGDKIQIGKFHLIFFAK